MAGEYDLNIQLDNEFTYQQYAPPVTPLISTTNISGDVNIVTTINGATGPITFTSPDGYTFSGGVGGIVSMTVDNPSLARSALGAAASGVNTDITQLNGASQVDVSGEYKVSGTQVVSARNTGWSDPTGASSKAAFDPATVTLPELGQFVAALYFALQTHGLIGN